MSHRCKEGQPASCIDSRITDRHGESQAHSGEKGRYKTGPISQRENKASRAPWWSASGDFLARKMQDQPRA